MRERADAGAGGELHPSKIVAVHLNYRSRAEERGRTPAVPSYFLKPPSSLSEHGAPVVRPRGCRYLNFEGEIALVIGRRARRVSLDEALGHVGYVTAANDFGVYDLRAADLGSNLRSKGQDGYTPIGPRLAPASELDPEALTLRTYVNGSLVQEASTDELLFSFAYLIADLSRLVTLEPGDIVLTGTPAGSRPVEPGDVVTVEVTGVGLLENTIVESDHELEPLGAMPTAGPAVRAASLGTPAHRVVELSPEAMDAFRRVSTATLTSQLLKRGVRSTFLAGLRPTRPDLRLVGHAFTLRWVPAREDVAAKAKAGALNAQRQAVETIGEGDVLVMDARNELGAATLGDILAMRIARRGAAGVVTDGCLRDSPAFASIEMPAYYRAPHASVAGILHHPLDINVPIACAGVLVMPGDILVGDAEGVVVVPAAMAEEVARDALEQELAESFAFERVSAGESTVGLFPISDARQAEYERWKAERSAGEAG
jgi:2-keto-4-pentenoate hydratase/2-oxohepta-3-ene-1,7-dioic acid hydratase in catechol pathway/regulator of RNase E activity RraA